jgi:hypothetical protein
MAPVYAALDLAKSSGVCWGEAFQPPTFETWVFKAKSRPARFHELRIALAELLYRAKPAKVFIEEPVSPHILAGIGSSVETALQLNGMVALAEELCWHRGVATELFNRQKVLGHFTGQPRFKKKDDGKRACLVRCKQLGWDAEGFDQADAAALWDYGCARESPSAWALAGVDRAMKRRVTK